VGPRLHWPGVGRKRSSGCVTHFDGLRPNFIRVAPALQRRRYSPAYMRIALHARSALTHRQTTNRIRSGNSATYRCIRSSERSPKRRGSSQVVDDAERVPDEFSAWADERWERAAQSPRIEVSPSRMSATRVFALHDFAAAALDSLGYASENVWVQVGVHRPSSLILSIRCSLYWGSSSHS
jgi:hypothetical protein